MERVSINKGRISVEIPEGFHEMTAEECKAMGGKPSADNWVALRDDPQLIYNIGWKGIPLLARKTPLWKVIGVTEKNFSNAIRTYKKLQDVTAEIDGKETLGFRYSYTSKEEEYISEYLMMIHNKQNIGFICTGKADTFEEYYPIFRSMLDGITIE